MLEKIPQTNYSILNRWKLLIPLIHSRSYNTSHRWNPGKIRWNSKNQIKLNTELAEINAGNVDGEQRTDSSPIEGFFSEKRKLRRQAAPARLPRVSALISLPTRGSGKTELAPRGRYAAVNYIYPYKSIIITRTPFSISSSSLVDYVGPIGPKSSHNSVRRLGPITITSHSSPSAASSIRLRSR